MTAGQQPTDLGLPERLPQPHELDASAGVCAFLSNVLLRVEAGPVTVQNLDAATINAWPFAGANADTEAGLAALREAVASPVSDEELEADYRRLFVGPGHMLAPPWESVHRSDEGLTFEAETLGVRAAYAEFGLQAPALNKEPDDHIGLELAFIGELAVAALNAAEAGDVGGQAAVLHGASRFMAEHVSQWAPAWAVLVHENASTALYRAVGLLLAGALPELGRVLSA